MCLKHFVGFGLVYIDSTSHYNRPMRKWERPIHTKDPLDSGEMGNFRIDNVTQIVTSTSPLLPLYISPKKVYNDKFQENIKFQSIREK